MCRSDAAKFPHHSLGSAIQRSRPQKSLQFGFSLTPSMTISCGESDQTTEAMDLQVFQALFRTRTGDPLLTMEVLYQLS
jgi:hypothetical protein